MTPGARTEAAIEILDQVIEAAKEGGAAADTVVMRYFTTRRYAGSKDRRAVRELVYAAIRRAGERPATGRAAVLALADTDPALAETFDGGTHAPAPIGPDEPRAAAGPAPEWLVDALAASGVSADAMTALVGRAPLDLRVNRLKATRDEVLALLPEAQATSFAPDGLRLSGGGNIEAMPAYRDGMIEVQDEGSQIVGLALGAKPGERIVDLCAGAGGKTLALAAAMANEGVLIAADVDRTRLSKLAPRAARAGVTIATTLLLDPNREAESLADRLGTADGVLVDAPCSGTGTWRRNPEARWRLTPERIDRLATTQARLLALAATLVKPSGALAYIVCSLLDAEGTDQVDVFLAAHPGWTAEPLALPAGRTHGSGWRLDPALDGTDGFFVARLRAPC